MRLIGDEQVTQHDLGFSISRVGGLFQPHESCGAVVPSGLIIEISDGQGMLAARVAVLSCDFEPAVGSCGISVHCACGLVEMVERKQLITQAGIEALDVVVRPRAAWLLPAILANQWLAKPAANDL